MAAEQNERLPTDTQSIKGNGADREADVDAGTVFGFYLVMGVLVALVIAGVVFALQH